ncbi:MAG: hypothetical protein OJF50_003776 [Nitrospira sp.]|nr:hypothetical protein [Nitrospira sp.]
MHDTGSWPPQLFGLVTGGTGRPELTQGLLAPRPRSLRSAPFPWCHDAKLLNEDTRSCLVHSQMVSLSPGRGRASDHSLVGRPRYHRQFTGVSWTPRCVRRGR